MSISNLPASVCQPRICAICGQTYFKRKTESRKSWTERISCSKECAAIWFTRTKRKQHQKKHCLFCKKELVRGERESNGSFRIRKYCGFKCFGMHKRRADAKRAAKYERSWKETAKYKKTYCEGCGTTEKKLCVHHDDGNIENNHPSNLRTFCHTCHSKWHWDQNWRLTQIALANQKTSV